MKRITFTVATALILGALTLALPKLRSNVQANPVASPAAPQIGGKACKNVKFKFDNQRSDKAKISIEQIRYTLLNKYDHTENVHTDHDCLWDSDGTHPCTTTGDNLPDALNRDLTKISIVYRSLPPGSGQNWSDRLQTPTINKTISDCTSGNTYDLGTIPPK